MNNLPKKSAPGVIGLDLGDHTLKAVQLSAGKIVAAMALNRLEPGSPFSYDEALRLREVMERQGFVGRRVQISLPGRAAMTSVLTLPPRKDGLPLDDIARAEMLHEHRCEDEPIEMEYWDLPKPARAAPGTHVMAVACRHTVIEPILDALTSAGFDVLGLDMEGWATLRACEQVMSSEKGIVAAVDMGWDSTTLVLIHEGVVVYERSTFGVGVRQLREQYQRELNFEPKVIDYLLENIGFELDMRGVDDDWKLLVKSHTFLDAHFGQVARELLLSIDYAHSQYPQSPVEQVLIHGGGAAIPGAAQHLSDRIDTPVMAVRPRDIVKDAEEIGVLADLPSLILSMGLASSMANESVSNRKGAA